MGEDGRYRNYILNKMKNSISVCRELSGSDDIEFNVNNITPILTSLGISGADPTILELIKEAENKANGRINPADVEAALVSIAIENGEDEELYFEEAFDILDLDNDGYITAGDMYRVYERLDIQVSEDELTGLIDNIDLDRDGRVGYEDFRDFMLRGNQASQKNINDDNEKTDNVTSNGSLSNNVTSYSGNSRRSSRRKLTDGDSQYHLVSEQKRLLLSYVGYVQNTAPVVNYLQNQAKKVTNMDKDQESLGKNSSAYKRASKKEPIRQSIDYSTAGSESPLIHIGSANERIRGADNSSATSDELESDASCVDSNEGDASCENITVVDLLNNINSLTPNLPKTTSPQPEEHTTQSPQPPEENDSVDVANDPTRIWSIPKIDLHKDVDFYGPGACSVDSREQFEKHKMIRDKEVSQPQGWNVEQTRMSSPIKAKETDLISIFPSRRYVFNDKFGSSSQSSSAPDKRISPLPDEATSTNVHGYGHVSKNHSEMSSCLTVASFGASVPRNKLKKAVPGLEETEDSALLAGGVLKEKTRDSSLNPKVEKINNGGDGLPRGFPKDLNPLIDDLLTDSATTNQAAPKLETTEPDLPQPDNKEMRLYMAERLASFINHGYSDPYHGDGSFTNGLDIPQRKSGYVKIENFHMPTIVTPRTPRAKTANPGDRSRKKSRDSKNRPRTAVATLATPRELDSTPRDYVIGDALVARHLLSGRTRGNPVRESLVVHNTDHSGYVFGNLWAEDSPVPGSQEQTMDLDFVSPIHPNRRTTPRQHRPRTTQSSTGRASVREIVAPRAAGMDETEELVEVCGRKSEDDVVIPLGMNRDGCSVSDDFVRDVNKGLDGGYVRGGNSCDVRGINKGGDGGFPQGGNGCGDDDGGVRCLGVGYISPGIGGENVVRGINKGSGGFGLLCGDDGDGYGVSPIGLCIGGKKICCDDGSVGQNDDSDARRRDGGDCKGTVYQDDGDDVDGCNNPVDTLGDHVSCNIIYQLSDDGGDKGNSLLKNQYVHQECNTNNHLRKISGDQECRIKIPVDKETINNGNKDSLDQLVVCDSQSVGGSTSHSQSTCECSIERLQSLYSSLNWVPEGMDQSSLSTRTIASSELTTLRHTEKTAKRLTTSDHTCVHTADKSTRNQARCVSVSGHVLLSTRGHRSHSARPKGDQDAAVLESSRLSTIQIGQGLNPSSEQSDQKNKSMFRPFHRRPKTSVGTLRHRRTGNTTPDVSSPVSARKLECRVSFRDHKNGRVASSQEPKACQDDSPQNALDRRVDSTPNPLNRRVQSAREFEDRWRHSPREWEDKKVFSSLEVKDRRANSSTDRWNRVESDQRSPKINKPEKSPTSNLAVKNISELVNGFPTSTWSGGFRPLSRAMVSPSPRQARVVENSSISRSLETKCLLLQHDDLTTTRKRTAPEVDPHGQKTMPVIKAKTVITLELPRATWTTV